MLIKFLTTVLTAGLAVVRCSPLPDLDARQDDGGFLVVTGVPDNGVSPRLEIRTLAEDDKQFTLFVQALEQMMNEDQSNKTSFFQIAAIHSRPYVEWDGASTPDGPRQAGYCPHSSNLFATWHRPYMALMEQLLHQNALEIANQFGESERDEYIDKANSLRLPYWDWAAKFEPAFPQVMTEEQIDVTRPDGTTETIANPLYAYTFHPIRTEDFGNNEWGHYKHSVRCVASDDPDAESNNDAVEQAVKDRFTSLQQRTYSLFTQQNVTFNEFSSNDGARNNENLESVHAVIHSSFNKGHMTPTDYAAFDPVFYLHHSNVDRLLAMWQVLNPDTYVKPATASGNTWTIATGSRQGPASPLTPFHNDSDGNYWTSKSSKDITAFQYTYPELQDNPDADTLQERINTLFGSGSNSMATQQIQTRQTPPNTVQTVYRVDVVGTPSPVGPYDILIFLGEPASGTSPAAWTSDPNFAGLHSIFTSVDPTNLDMQLPGQVDVTTLLQGRQADLKDTTAQTITEYLTENLRWAAVAGDRQYHSPDVTGVLANVTSVQLQPASAANKFPQFIGQPIVIGQVQELTV